MPGPANSPPGQLQADPTLFGMGAWNVSLGPGGLFAVSSFNLESRVHPVTMAQDGSSVNGGSVTTRGPLPLALGEALWLGFGTCRGWDMHVHTLRAEHKHSPQAVGSTYVQGTGLQCAQ